MGILVIDDSEEGRDITEAVLLAAGYKDVTTVGSAADAFARLSMGGPTSQPLVSVDLLLLDIVMPGMDGIEACAHIRNDPRYCDVPIIMATSLADTDSLANAFVAGATDYITKPMQRVELLARVRSALKLKSELDRRQARERELLQFMSTWCDRRDSGWIDRPTGLFVGELAEAYLFATPDFPSGGDSSIIALAVDRLDAYRTSQGSEAADDVMARVARTVRATATTVGVVVGAYSNGVIVLIVPELRLKAALALGEALRASISRLAIAKSESIAADHVTASVVVATAKVSSRIDRIRLLSRAILAIPQVSAAGGDRVVVEDG
jgi:sigma-B regulation protein RsbU (phosphoserine phosphatase)